MHKKDFFEILTSELPNDKYKERLLKELEGHWEDSENHSKDGEKSLGDPKDFIHFYNHIMKKPIPLYLEALFVGICSIPLSAFLGVLANLVMAIRTFEELEEIRIALWMIILAILGLIFTVFYGWIWSYLKKSFPSQNLHSKIPLILLLAPSWYYFETLAIVVALDGESSVGAMAPVSITLYLLVQSAAAWKSQNKKTEKDVYKIPQWINLPIILGLFALIIMYFGASFADVIQTPFSWIYAVTMVPFMNHLLLGLWFLAFVFGLLMIYSFVGVFQSLANKQGFSWGKAFLGFLLLYTFTFQGGDDSEVISWTKPTVNLTEVWERDQVGILYPWFSFTSKNGSFTFTYAAKWTEEGLELVNQEDSKILFTGLSENPSELTWTSSQEKDSYFFELWNERATYLPEEFRCIDDLGVATSPELGGGTVCRELYFQDELIYSSPITISFNNILVSPSKEWILIHFPWQSTVGNTQISEQAILVHITQ